MSYELQKLGRPDMVIFTFDDRAAAIAHWHYGEQVFETATGEVVYPVYPFVHATQDASWVVYAPDHAEKVDSPRIRQAKYALRQLPPHTPDVMDYQVWQETVRQPLGDELAAAMRERIDELMARPRVTDVYVSPVPPGVV